MVLLLDQAIVVKQNYSSSCSVIKINMRFDHNNQLKDIQVHLVTVNSTEGVYSKL